MSGDLVTECIGMLSQSGELYARAQQISQLIPEPYPEP
jgi:hypothetical protein